MAFDSVGRFREAEAQFRRVIELSPGAPWGHAGVGWVFVREERFDDAVREASLESEEFTRLTVQAHAYWGQDKRRESDAALDRLIATGADTSAYQVAEIYAYRRDHDHAFEWLERAYRQHDPGLAWAKCDASLARIHDDRRWAAFLTKLGLSEPGAPR